ncbi:MAG: threonine ammonia-lyase [Erysipelothrix sp.]
MIDIDKVFDANDVLQDIVTKTPVVKAEGLSEDVEVFLKCENLQKTGSFKLRGATYFLSQLSQDEKNRGVIAWSAGNHAQGVAHAAKNLGIKATIFIPECGSASKIAATRAMGANVKLVPGCFDDAKRVAKAYKDVHELVGVPPFNDDDIIAGQATVALEMIEQIKEFDAVVVPVGGGGLISGIAYVIKTLMPHCKVYGVEAEGAASMRASLQNQDIQCLSDVETIADGIAVKEPGSRNFMMTQQYVDDIITVSDYEISESILHIMEKNKMIVEGAGATAFAAIKFDKLPEHKRIACVLSGGNIDIELLNKVVSRALFQQRRLVKFKVEIPDRSGSLHEIIEIIANEKGNIVNVEHDRFHSNMKINYCIAKIAYEAPTVDTASIIEQKLQQGGYQILV